VEIVERKADQFQILIHSIPYQVNKSELIIKMADMVREKKLEGIRDIRIPAETPRRILSRTPYSLLHCSELFPLVQADRQDG